MREETFLALKSLMKQDDADDMEDAYKLYTKDQVKDSKYKDYKAWTFICQKIYL